MTAEPVGAPRTPQAFAHASEAEFARILAYYQVRWEYEPRTFPILWNLDGKVVESFTPDFYLPDLELYVELTTLRQSLVRKKNRKLRRLRELYPEIRIKLFYARDFRALMLKYGRLELVGELSGSSGQGNRGGGDVGPQLPAPGAPAAEVAAAEVAGVEPAVRQSPPVPARGPIRRTAARREGRPTRTLARARPPRRRPPAR